MSQWFFLKELAAAVHRDRNYTRQRLEQFQQLRLQRLLAHAVHHVPFQRSRLRSTSGKLRVLSEIPPTDKQQMMDRFDLTVCNRAVTTEDVQRCAESTPTEIPRIHGQYLLSKTSGTTGEPGWFLNDARSWSMQRGAVMARTIRDRLVLPEILRFSWGRRYRMAFLVSDSAFSVAPQSAQTPMLFGRLFAAIRTISIQKRLDEIIDELNAFRPHYVHAYPSFMELIAHARREGQPIHFDPEIMSFGSEPFTALAHQAIRSAFPGTSLRNQYGTTECVPLGNQCYHGRMHLNTDYCLVELMDESGRPSPPGEFSDHVLITNLVNTIQPIIRYRVDDAIRLHEQDCPCGSAFPVFEIQGRRDDAFHVLNSHGRYCTLPPLGMTLPMLKVEGMLQFQAVHERQNVIRFSFIPRRQADPSSVATEIRQRFEELLRLHDSDRTVTLSVEAVSDLPRTSGGKLRPFVSCVDPASRSRVA